MGKRVLESGKSSKNVRFADVLANEYIGKGIAIWCARYTYRGIVTEVGEDFVRLSNPKAVEASGSATGREPNTEDPIPSDLIIALNAVEQFCQPTWVNNGLFEDETILGEGN